ncbi:MAG TPA: PHB depolymerase family esterase [Gemmatimonadales bacterium]|jgi:polyhydroxybutyrate depolymerase
MLRQLVLALVLLQNAGAAPTPALAQSAPANQSRSLRVGDMSRTYFLHVPLTLDRSRPAPLVLVFHGAGGRGVGFARHTGFSKLADEQGFIAVFPDGIRRRWNDGRSSGPSQNDVGFIRSLLASLTAEFAIDPRRIYATGISNGAMFAYRLACDLPGVFAAIAPVAGALPAELAPRCTQSEPLSVVAFQGTADRFVPYAGGAVGRRRGRVLSAEETMAFWARAEGCSLNAVSDLEPDREPGDGTKVRRSEYPGCSHSRELVLYTIEGGGHTWPGGPSVARLVVGRVTRDIDATATIWDFFERHPKP